MECKKPGFLYSVVLFILLHAVIHDKMESDAGTCQEISGREMTDHGGTIINR